MKKDLLWMLIIISIIILISCNGNSEKTATSSNTDTATTRLDDNSSVQKEVPDQAGMDFVSEVSMVNMMEVQLGEIAGQKASSDRVKKFGAMMVADHNAANNDLKSTAMSNDITVPTAVSADKQMEINMLKAKKGKDFDKAYIDMMIDGHKKNISKFKDVSDNMKFIPVKSFASRTLPALQKHLDSAQAIKSSL